MLIASANWNVILERPVAWMSRGELNLQRCILHSYEEWGLLPCSLVSRLINMWITLYWITRPLERVTLQVQRIDSVYQCQAHKSNLHRWNIYWVRRLLCDVPTAISGKRDFPCHLDTHCKTTDGYSVFHMNQGWREGKKKEREERVYFLTRFVLIKLVISQNQENDEIQW